MKFQIANTHGKGRPAGSLNKRSQDFLEILEKNKFCTASAMLDLYKISLQRMTEDMAMEDANTISRMESNAPKYMKLCADLLIALSSYAYPKLKAVEQVKHNEFEGMTLQEKLEASEATVEFVKLQIKANEPKTS